MAVVKRHELKAQEALELYKQNGLMTVDQGYSKLTDYKAPVKKFIKFKNFIAGYLRDEDFLNYNREDISKIVKTGVLQVGYGDVVYGAIVQNAQENCRYLYATNEHSIHKYTECVKAKLPDDAERMD